MKTDKSIGYIARKYGAGLREFPHPLAYESWGRVAYLDFATLELRVLGMYAGYDPRNHVGKYAYRRTS